MLFLIQTKKRLLKKQYVLKNSVYYLLVYDIAFYLE